MFENPTPSSGLPNKPPEDMFAGVNTGAPPPAAPSAPSPMPGLDLEEKSGIRPKPFIIAGAAIIVLAAGAVAFWVFFLQTPPIETPTNTSPQTTTPPPANTTPPQPVSVCGNGICEVGESSASCALDCAPPPVVTPTPPADTDGDGLSDEREAQLGTNPESADTDGDGLFDKEEVDVYGTDPKNPDTDGDGFNDGTEVRNGYNPRGPGRLLEVPR